MTPKYAAVMEQTDAGGFGVWFPDFPGCITAGRTLDEARRMASEALAFHVQGMREDGEQIPDPSTLDDLHNDPAMKGAVALRPFASSPRADKWFSDSSPPSILSLRTRMRSSDGWTMPRG